MPEGSHGWGNCKCVTYLVYHTKPATNIRQAAGGGKVTYGLEELVLRFDASVGDLEAQVVNFLFRKLKFRWIENHPRIGAFVQECTNLVKVLLNGVCPQEGVIDALLHVSDALHDEV